MAATLLANSFDQTAPMVRTQPQGRPPAPRRAACSWADTLFAGLAHGAAWLTLALLAGIIGSLVVGAAPAVQKFGLGFLWSTDWDPVKDQYGGLVMIYGTLMTSAIALVIAVPVSFGIALLPDRAVAFMVEAPARNRDRIARCRAVDRLRHVGSARVRPVAVAIRAAAAAGDARRRALPRQPLHRAAGRHRPALGRDHPGHHGDSVHRRGDARRVRGDAADAQGIGLRPRLDDLGSDVEGRPAVHEDGRGRRRSCSASAARSARRWR